MDLADVVAANTKRLRASTTMAAVSDAARQYGARWNSGSIAKIEAASTRLTVETLLLLSLALTDATSSEVTISDLLDAAGELLDITPTSRCTDAQLLDFLSGRAPSVRRHFTVPDHTPDLNETPLPPSLLAEGWPLGRPAKVTEPEQRLAASMSLSDLAFDAWSQHLWHSTFTEERDRRAGRAANAQRKGRVTRSMKNELLDAIQRHIHGNNREL